MLERGVFLDLETVDQNDLDLSLLASTLPHWTWHDFTQPHELGSRIAKAQVIVTNKVVLDALAFAQAPELKLVCLTATGTNNVDLEAAKTYGVTVCNARDYATDSVVQHVFALILALITRLDDYTRDVRSGLWQDSRHFCLLNYPIREIKGLSMGIIGYGVLGKAVADTAKALGLKVMIAESLVRPKQEQAERVSLEYLLEHADIISLHCPLTPDTKHLINEAALQRMKSSAILINTARGAIVDAQALAKALREQRIGAAGLDVLEKEPPPADHPLLADDIPNLIITPHIAWAALGARQRLVHQVAENIIAFMQGRPRNQVT